MTQRSRGFIWVSGYTRCTAAEIHCIWVRGLVHSNAAMFSTLESESSDRGSNLRAALVHATLLLISVTLPRHELFAAVHAKLRVTPIVRHPQQLSETKRSARY